MTNLASIRYTAWDTHVSEWRKRGEVDLASIVKLLETGEPVPAEATALLAGLLTGAVKARRGLKPGIFASLSTRRMVADDVARLETMLADPATIPDEFGKESRDVINALRLRNGGTMNSKARELVAEIFGISKSYVAQLITERNRGLQVIATQHGVTLADVKIALRIGEP